MELVIEGKDLNKAYYLLPLTGIPIKDEVLEYLVNVYFADKHNNTYNEHLFLLFNLKDISEDEVILWCEKSALFIDHYRYNNYLMCVFEYLPKWKNDVQLYKQGKYSRTSTNFKETVLQGLFGFNSRDKNLYKALYPKMKDRVGLAERLNVDEIPMEIWAKPNLSIEEFNISNYIEIIKS